MAIKHIEETVYPDSPTPVVDGIIKGAKLLGLNSRNGRRYEGAALEKAKSLYEGRKVYVDHPRRDDQGGDRKFNDFAGVIENVTFRKGDGLYGDVVLRQESSHFKGIVEVASNPKFQKSCGFSHVADGESRLDGDTEIIESIREVFSVDLVTDPATTAGFFESKRTKKTLRSAIESLPTAEPVRKRLIEMADAGMLDGNMPMDDGDEPDSADDDDTPLVAVLKQVIDALTETLRNLSMAANQPAPAPAAPAVHVMAPPAAPAAPPAPAAKPAGMESLQAELAAEKAKNLLLESGREATPVRIKALASVTDEAERTELLESWPVLESADGLRPVRSPAAIEAADASPERIKESFAALRR